MAATKSGSSFTWASGSATTGGTTNAMSCLTDYVQEVYVSIAQQGTPTTPASFFIQWSPDGSTFYSGQTYTSPLAPGTTTWVVAVPVTSESVQIVYAAQSGGTSSTLSAQLGQVSGV